MRRSVWLTLTEMACLMWATPMTMVMVCPTKSTPSPTIQKSKSIQTATASVTCRKQKINARCCEWSLSSCCCSLALRAPW